MSKFTIGVIAILAILAIGVVGCSEYAKTETVTLHITGKESVNTKDGHEYRVYAQEDTYVIQDSIVHPRFDSSRLYGRLTPGTYNCKVYGWRIAVMSSFKNILDCEPLRPSEVRNDG